MSTPHYIDERLNGGEGNRSCCEICPLNGQRKCGSDGNPEAEHIAITDCPSRADAEERGVMQGYPGRVLSDAVGYYWKLEHLVPAGHATLRLVEGKRWPIVELTNIQVMGVTLCNPPRKGRTQPIDTPKGRAAVRCCANSLRYRLRQRLAANPNVSIGTLGTTALTVLLGRKATAELHRGFVLGPFGPEDWAKMLAPEPELDIIKAVLRGQHPKEIWWERFEKTLMTILRLQRSGLTKAAKTPPLEAQACIWFVREIIKRQRAVLVKRAKREVA